MLSLLLHQIGLYGVLAVGAAVVIISGGIDLSVGAVVALVLGHLRQADDPVAAGTGSEKFGATEPTDGHHRPGERSP